MARALRSEAEHELGVLLDAELRTRVEQVLGASGESPLPEVVARRLGMSVRTLQRRLGEEGTSFREIRDSVRLSRARRLLTEARLSISEVAERLGFADVSAFDNAFKRWTGETPNALRARLQASEGARSTGARSRSG